MNPKSVGQYWKDETILWLLLSKIINKHNQRITIYVGTWCSRKDHFNSWIVKMRNTNYWQWQKELRESQGADALQSPWRSGSAFVLCSLGHGFESRLWWYVQGAFFPEISRGHHVNYEVRVLSDSLDRELASLSREAECIWGHSWIQ